MTSSMLVAQSAGYSTVAIYKAPVKPKDSKFRQCRGGKLFPSQNLEAIKEQQVQKAAAVSSFGPNH